jgi:hypothetical protein
MLKTLIYGNRKQPDMKWDISTPELRAEAFLELFKFLKMTWKVYQCGYWGKTEAEKTKQHRLYGLANAGDGKAAEKLLKMRIDYEYENWHIVSVPKNNGEPKLVLSRRRKSPYVKDLYGSSEGRTQVTLDTGEKIEFAYIPINTTSDNWENGFAAATFVREALYEKCHKDNRLEKTLDEVLSHMNYMRLALHYTLHPEALRLGASLPSMQRRALETAASLIDQHGDSAVEELKTTPERPTDIQKAQNAISSLTLLLESSQRLMGDLIKGKYHPTAVQHDHARIGKDLEAIKESMRTE